MKKFVISLIACFAFAQSMHAACGPLCNSVIEYRAILDSSQLGNVVPSTEFIVGIQRITKKVDITGTVRYRIVTRLLNGTESQSDIEAAFIEAACSEGNLEKTHSKKKQECRTYIATLLVESNPAIGPRVATVLSITPTGGHKCPKTETLLEVGNLE